MGVKHSFTSAKADGGDATLVRPIDWNDDHVMAAASRILGRITAGAGDVEELTAAQVKTILALLHSDLGSIGANDHHAETHAINAAVHTGVLTDGQIPASIARDTELHAQAHGAADHTDITRTIWFFGNVLLGNEGAGAANVGATPDMMSELRTWANAATTGSSIRAVMPTDYVAGSDVSVDIYYSPDGSAAANARLRINWAVIDSGDQIDEVSTQILFTQAVGGTTDALEIATRQTFTPTGLAAGELLRINCYRLGADAADTYTGAVRVVGLLVTYTASQ